jgi:hypothetical protein
MLNKSILDVGFGMLRASIKYKGVKKRQKSQSNFANLKLEEVETSSLLRLN